MNAAIDASPPVPLIGGTALSPSFSTHMKKASHSPSKEYSVKQAVMAGESVH